MSDIGFVSRRGAESAESGNRADGEGSLQATFRSLVPQAPTQVRGRLHCGRLLLTLLLSAVTAAADIPSVPEDGRLIADLAGIIHEADEQALSAFLEQVLEQCQVPIAVVTIRRMSDYDPGSPSIESFARRWFDTWGIGYRGSNNGVLVIVSSGDRKARIELGADWGGRFDGFCRQLMDKKMVPQFRDGHYGAGLTAAVASLGELAKRGPEAEAPDEPLSERILTSAVFKFATQSNPIGQRGGAVVLVLMVVAGLGCLTAACFFPAQRKTLIIVGFILIGLAVLFWVVFAIFVLWNVATGRVQIGVGGGGYGGGGSGGGFGGGTSGGGGASGSW